MTARGHFRVRRWAVLIGRYWAFSCPPVGSSSCPPTKGQLRGEITKDEGQQAKRESTKFTGDHYVECYIVKDGICVAWAHEPVVIT